MACLVQSIAEIPYTHFYQSMAHMYIAELLSSVGSVADLRTGGRWFDARLGQYSFLELMIVIATGSIPLSPLSVVSITWESSRDITEILLKTCVKHHTINQLISNV